MLDFDLAALYQVTTKVLNQAVRRNRERFPEDFMFQLTLEESKELNRLQIVIGLLCFGFRLSVNRTRDSRFEVPIWDLKLPVDGGHNL